MLESLRVPHIFCPPPVQGKTGGPAYAAKARDGRHQHGQRQRETPHQLQQSLRKTRRNGHFFIATLPKTHLKTLQI